MDIKPKRKVDAENILMSLEIPKLMKKSLDPFAFYENVLPIEIC